MTERKSRLTMGFFFYACAALCFGIQAFDFRPDILILGVAFLWVGEVQFRLVKK